MTTEEAVLGIERDRLEQRWPEGMRVLVRSEMGNGAPKDWKPATLSEWRFDESYGWIAYARLGDAYGPRFFREYELRPLEAVPEDQEGGEE